MKRLIAIVFYYGVASRLPNYSFPGGRIFNWLRVVSLKGFSKVGTNCRIMKGVYLGNGLDVIIGDYCRINENVRLDNVRIGDHCMIARDSVILGKAHETSRSDVPMEQQGNQEMEQAIIEDDVWLGLRVVVMPGIIIGKGSIVGACALVTKDIEPLSVVGGVPAGLIRHRN